MIHEHFIGYVILLIIGCDIGLPNTGVTSCTAVTQDCGVGYYYSEHHSRCHVCGSCKDGELCTEGGYCLNGCDPWFYPSNVCWGLIYENDPWLSLSHIILPSISDVTHDEIEVCFIQNQTLIESDMAKYYVYQIQFADRQNPTYNDDVDYIPVSNDAKICRRVNGLTANRDYRFRVAILRQFEQRLYEVIDVTAAAQAKTLCGNPPKPKIIRGVILESLTAIRIEWEEWGWSECDGYKEFRLWHKPLNSSSNTPIWVQESQREETVYNLTPGQPYRFIMEANNLALLNTHSVPFEINLIREVFLAQEALLREEVSSRPEAEIDDSDDINYASIAIAVVAAALAIAAIVIAVILFMKLKKLQTGNARPVTPVKPPSTSQIQRAGYVPNGRPALPPRDGSYEGLGEPEPTGDYMTVNNCAYSYAPASGTIQSVNNINNRL